jgi:methionyl aminopeptidase
VTISVLFPVLFPNNNNNTNDDTFITKNKKGVMAPGHIFTVEPMINEGKWQDQTWPDNWTAVTIDGGLSAQFEHTVQKKERKSGVKRREMGGGGVDLLLKKLLL